MHEITFKNKQDLKKNSDFIFKASKIFSEKGFVVIKNIIPFEIINQVKHDLEEIVNEKKIDNSLRDVHFFESGEISSAHNLLNYIPSYKDLIIKTNVLDLIKTFYKDIEIGDFNSSYFAKPKYKGLETKPHQDNAFFCMEPASIATCWMPLTFAQKKNGCLYYYEGSHSLGNLNHVPEGNLGASMTVDLKNLEKVKKKFNKTYIELKLGDCVIHNALVVHGSEANASEYDRNAFNFSVGCNLAKRNHDLFRTYKNNLDNFLKKKKLNRIN